MRTRRHEVGRASFGVAETTRPSDNVLVFCNAIWNGTVRPRMFEPDDHDCRSWRIDAHGKRRGRDDDAQARIALAKVLLDYAPLVPPQMRVVERNASRKRLTQVESGLGRISRGKIGERLSGWLKTERLREIVRPMPRLACCLAKYDDLLVFADEPPHQRNDPVAMLAFTIERLDQSLLR